MRRRTVLGVAGIGVTALGTAAYSAAPRFWQQYAWELGRPVSAAPEAPRPLEWPDRGLHAAWLGHSTVLIKADGVVILTDPVFSSRVGLNFGPLTLGLKRLVAPALDPVQLPKIDLILLSHAHMDHMDLPSLRRLEGAGTAVVMASKTADLIRANRYKSVRELGWGERTTAAGIEVRAFEVNHWGARMRTDTYRGYNGYTLDAGRHRILFAGDTANTDLFRGVRSSRSFDLAVMPVGAYNPWIYYHCTPEQAWRMGNDAGVERFIPVHHRTFQLSREPLAEPLERFLTVAGNQTDRVLIHQIGQQVSL